MDKLEYYRAAIVSALKELGTIRVTSKDLRSQIIEDTKNDHYLLFLIGWDGDERIYGCVIHVDIIDEKIWIQYDGTNVGIAELFLEKGISKEEIVLAFHHPDERKYTGYAVCA